MEGSITKLAEYGSVGVCVALIVALVWIVKYLLDANSKREDILSNIIGNHIDHQSVCMDGLSLAIKELSTIIREKLK